MKKHALIGIFATVVILICLFLVYFFFWKKVGVQKQGYVVGTGTTEIASASGAAF